MGHPVKVHTVGLLAGSRQTGGRPSRALLLLAAQHQAEVGTTRRVGGSQALRSAPSVYRYLVENRAAPTPRRRGAYTAEWSFRRGYR